MFRFCSARVAQVLIGCVVLGALWLGGSTPAQAWKRATVRNRPDTPLFWASRRLEIRTAYDTCEDVTPGSVRVAVLRSLNTWSTAGDGCSDLSLVEGDYPTGLGTNLTGVRDRKNRVVWRETAWPGSDWVRLVGPGALAVTTVWYERATGALLDADIDVNGVHHTWTVTDDPELVLTDMQNAVTHELGHVIGLAHSDDLDATMYAESPPGDLIKRDLATDDVDAICSVYPYGSEPPAGLIEGAPPPVTGTLTCSAHSTAPVGAWVPIGFAVVLLLCRRTKRAKAGSRRAAGGR